MAEAIPPQTRRKSSLLWVLAGSAAFAALVFGTIGYLYFHDDPPPDDADLRVASPLVPDDQNGERVFEGMTKDQFAFIDYAKAHDVDDLSAQKILAGEMADDTLVAGYLAQVQSLMASAAAAVAQPVFEFSHPIGELLLPEISPYMGYGRALVLTAHQAETHGDYETAVQQIIQLRQLAARVAESHGPILEVLTATALEGMAEQAAIRLLNNPATSNRALESLLQIFQREGNFVPAYQQAFRLEYQFFIFNLDSHLKNPGSLAKLARTNDNWFFHLLAADIKPHQTMRLAADATHAAISAAVLDYATMTRQFPTLFHSDRSQWSYVDLFLPNGGGWFFFRITTIPLEGILTLKLTTDAHIRQLQAALALRHYFADHQSLPATLADLVPKYLPAIPLDPFNSQPLLFDPARGLVYSVGTSLKDNGGSKFLKIAKDSPNYDDPLSDKEQPTLQLEFQKPPPKNDSVSPAN